MSGIESVEVYRDAHLMRILHCQRNGKSAYYINPSVNRRELSLAIDETDSTCDVPIAMSAHRTFGISTAQANAALQSLELAVGKWRKEVTRFGISRAEQNLMVAAYGVRAKSRSSRSFRRKD